MKLRPQLVVNAQGQPSGVLLSMEEYQRLLDAVEDQLDAADLDEAVRDAEAFIAYDDVRENLRRMGMLDSKPQETE